MIDGNYSEVQPLVWERADTVIWLDLDRPIVMRRVVGRTWRRVLRRQELWNGNREPIGNLFALNPEESIIRWAWTKHGPTRTKYAAAMDDEANADLAVHRLRSPAAVDRVPLRCQPANRHPHRVHQSVPFGLCGP